MNNKYLNGTGLTQVWTKITNLLSGKVDVVEGKELSSNDYEKKFFGKFIQRFRSRGQY